jgi:acyl transferase domain-containing protein
VSYSGKRIAFLLPGTGDHHPGMGRELYAAEPVFAAVVDECLALLWDHHGVDLGPLLFPTDDNIDRAGDPFARMAAGPGRPRSGSDPESGPAAAHPFVFVVETALARLLASCGVTPDVLLGYSLGEYVAACLAGVLSIEDALRVVVERARLIEASPRGAMLAAAASEQDLQAPLARLSDHVTVAAVNGPGMTVLSGRPGAVAAAEKRLAAVGIAAIRMLGAHAYHSPLLRPARASLEAVVAAVPRSRLVVPIVSNVTGTWLTDAEAADPGYWSDHLCQPVQFAQGAATLAERADVYVEVGPGATLGTLLRQNGVAGPADPVLRTMRPPGERRNWRPKPVGEHDVLLQALDDLGPAPCG